MAPEKFAKVLDILVEIHSAQLLFLWGLKENRFLEAARSKIKSPSLPDYPILTISKTVFILEKVDNH